MIISVWSGPRCCSTALMYSWGQRADTVVHDEPLYAAYLVQTGATRPYREQVLKSQSSDGETVMTMLGKHAKEKHLYAKQMGKFVSTVQRKWLKEGVHFVLVRDPNAVIHSFSEVLEATLEETCYPALCRIVSELRAFGKKPVVVLSEDVLANPEGMLRAMCAHAGIEFEPAMLRWSAGPKPYDGVWAPYWYRQVHHSTGWAEPRNATQGNAQTLPDALKPLLHECYAMYNLLTPYALQPLHVPRPGSPPRLLAGHLRASGEPTTKAEALGALSVLPTHTVAPPDTSPPGATPGATPLATPPPTDRAKAYTTDARNADMLIGIRDGVTRRLSMQWRASAGVPALDAGFLFGDGVWEDFRIHRGCLLFVWAHMRRLCEGLAALDIHMDTTPSQVVAMLRRCADLNGMRSACGAQVRLIVTRGLKRTSSHQPGAIIGAPTIVMLPEWVDVDAAAPEQGVRVATAHVRKPPIADQEPPSSALSAQIDIAASGAAAHVHADRALILDSQGCVACCEDHAMFLVVPSSLARDTPFTVPVSEFGGRKSAEVAAGGGTAGRGGRLGAIGPGDHSDSLPGMELLDDSARSGVLRGVNVDDVEVWVVPRRHARHSVLRSNVIDVIRELGFMVRERTFTLPEVYSALEVFVTCPFSGAVPVVEADARQIGDGKRGCVTEAVQQAYCDMVSAHVDCLVSPPASAFPGGA